VSRASSLACAAYVLGGLLLGERFPFSRFAMYADRRFAGLAGASLRAPPGVVTAMDYVVHDWGDHFRAHDAAAGETPGEAAVDVAVAYDIVRVRDGSVVRERIVVARGTAWP
jgi:hypothetical protein